MDADLGLRERKKRRTRQALADAALRLFAERGFDATTVADIAAAADVSPRTFFSYFPTKEDVFFEDTQGRIELLGRMLAERPAGEPVLAVMRRVTVLAVADVRERWGHQLERARLMREIPSVRQRLRERWQAWEDALATQLAAETGAGPDDVEPYVVAAAVIGAFRAVVQVAMVTEMRFDLPAVVDRAFDLLEVELPGYGARPGPPAPSPPPPAPAPTGDGPA
jgi:AcrR family transcriptional regulator